MCAYGINYNKIIPCIYIILYSLLGYFHVYYYSKNSSEIKLGILIACYSAMFPNRQKSTNENLGNLVLISLSSESNTISDTRRVHLLNEMRFNYLLKVTVLTIFGAKIKCRPSGPNSSVCSPTSLLVQQYLPLCGQRLENQRIIK